MIPQKTIKYPISSCGIGLHSNKKIEIKILPAEPNTGIVFRRTDLDPVVEIPAKEEFVTKTTLSTTIGNENQEISTIEHLLSVLHGFSIDNAIIEINNSELPIMDGSSSSFVFLLQSAIVVEQDAPKKCIVITKEITIEEEGKSVSLKPYDGFKIDFSIDFNKKAINHLPKQCTYIHSLTSFIYEISRARTFGFEEDVVLLRKNNLALGGSLDNAIVIGEDAIKNKEGLRFEDEFVRHKILDAIGDLYLLGHNIIGEFSAYCSGHNLNNRLLKKLVKNSDCWEYVVLDHKDKITPGIAHMFHIDTK